MDRRRLPKHCYDVFSQGYFKSVQQCYDTLYSDDSDYKSLCAYAADVMRANATSKLYVSRDGSGYYEYHQGCSLPPYASHYKRYNIHLQSIGEL